MADIVITLTTIGADQGPLFDLYSNVDGFTSAFDTDVTEAALLGGYTSTTAPLGTSSVRVCGQGVKCVNCAEIPLVYTTTTSTTLAPIECESTTNSGGVGVTEYIIPLEVDGADLVFDFNAYGVPDKIEILHLGIKKATSGMTVANSGPFDDLYGDPTIPNNSQAMATDQFIGTSKAVPPKREAEILADLGKTFLVTGQQLVWWRYTNSDYLLDAYATIRITGPSGTAWELKRLCLENTTTTTTTLAPTTTTTTTTAAPTTTTTTTLTGLDEADLSSNTSVGADCGLALDGPTVYIDAQSPGLLTAGDIIFTDSGGSTIFIGNGDYYHIDLDGVGTEYTMRINAFGVVLAPVIGC